MKEKHVMLLLFPYLDGKLSDAERHSLEAHLAHCPRCREELEYTRHIQTLLARRPRETVSPYFWTRLTARLQQEIPPRAVRSGLDWAFRRLVPVLGAVTVLLAILFSVIHDIAVEPDMETYIEMWTPQEEMATLADASVLSRDEVLSLLISAPGPDTEHR